MYIMPQFRLTQTKNLDLDAMPLETSGTTVLSEEVGRFINLSTQISQVIVIFLSFHFEVGLGWGRVGSLRMAVCCLKLHQL